MGLLGNLKIAYTIIVRTALAGWLSEHSVGARCSLQVGGSGFDPRRLHQLLIFQFNTGVSTPVLRVC